MIDTVSEKSGAAGVKNTHISSEQCSHCQMSQISFYQKNLSFDQFLFKLFTAIAISYIGEFLICLDPVI